MKIRKVVLLLPYDENLNVLFQNRKKILKQYKKDYGFFGGGIEKGETIKQALAREILEELGMDINNLKELEFFKKFCFEAKEFGKGLELNLFLCKMPSMKQIICNEGEPEIINLSKIANLNISPWDKEMLLKVQKYLSK
jgi:8-oxo-dGTP pyrophosphatase MutT (NUDIX family)